jgi:hypothetical protein
VPEGAEIEIFDINGRLVAEISADAVGAGLKPARAGGSETLPYKITWRPDKSLGSGVYLIRIKGANASKKIIYMK